MGGLLADCDIVCAGRERERERGVCGSNNGIGTRTRTRNCGLGIRTTAQRTELKYSRAGRDSQAHKLAGNDDTWHHHKHKHKHKHKQQNIKEQHWQQQRARQETEGHLSARGRHAVALRKLLQRRLGRAACKPDVAGVGICLGRQLLAPTPAHAGFTVTAAAARTWRENPRVAHMTVCRWFEHKRSWRAEETRRTGGTPM